MAWSISMKAVHLLVPLLALCSFHSVKSQLDILFFEENFARVENATDNMIQVIKSGASIGPIEVRIDLFTVAEFEAGGGTLPGDVADPAEFEDGGLSDFNNPSLFLTFPPSDSEMTMSVPLGSTIIPDAINEAQEGLVMVLDVDVMSLDPEDATNLVPSSRGVALLFISDDDDIQIGFNQTTLTVSEEDGIVTQASAGILNGGTTEQSFTFLITYNDGVAPQATSPDDFIIISPVMPGGNTATVQFGPTTASVDITFEVIDDTTFESAETFSASISSTTSVPSGVMPSPGAQTLTVTIEDNEGPIEVGFVQSEFRVAEGSGQLPIEFVISNPADPSTLPTSFFVSLQVAVIDGTAMLSDHYAIGFMNNPNVLVGILPEGMVILDILDDTMINEDRTLRLTLTSNPGNPAPVNVVINETLVIIEDNDAPDLLEILPNPSLTVIEGSTVIITCRPVGAGDPVMLLENGMETDFTFSSIEDERIYNLGAALRENNGNIYQCVSGDSRTENTTLFVQYPPEYDGQTLFEAIEDNVFDIQLTLSGNPFPGDDTLVWTFDGMSLSAGGPISFTLDSISFSPISRNNTGTYTVTSGNFIDNATFQFEVTVFFPPVYDVDPIFTVVEGATNFRVTPSLEAFPIPAEGNFTWTSGGIQLVSGMGGVTFGVDFIEFDEVNRDLEGTTYEVQGSNVAGVDSTSFQLSVLFRPEYNVSSVFTVIEGNMEFIQLDLVANPTPDSFVWFLDGVPLASGGPVVLGVDSINFAAPINRSQAGTYRIEGTNVAGTGTDMFELNVLYPPTYNVDESFTVMEGSMLTIPLGLTGNPLPGDADANFFFNGSPLNEIPGLTFGADFIMFQMVTRMDEGEYMVNATNVAGVGMDTFQLIVTMDGPTSTPMVTDVTPPDIVTAVMTPDPATTEGTGGNSGDNGGMGGDSGGMGGDPHFSIILPTGQQLCFSVQGEHGFSFNLVTSPMLTINARFDQDARRSEVTWIGSLGMVFKKKQMTVKIRFDSSTKSIYIDDRAAILAKSIDKLVVKRGKIQLSEKPLGLKDPHAAPEVQVEVVDMGISFGVRFMKSHIDMLWQKMKGEHFTNSHGMLGQFFRSGVEVDEARRLLILPNMEPVPVMRKPIWHFMERDTPDEQLCWVAMNPGYQGKHLIEGYYLDYLVDNVLSPKFKFKGGKYNKLIKFFKKGEDLSPKTHI